MLLVIHNLPSHMRYSDVKTFIKDKCGLTELILDNLVAEGQGKKVTVGLADEGDANTLLRKVNGQYIGNQQVYVEDVRQKKGPNQQLRSNTMPENQFDQMQQNQYPPQQFNMQFYDQQSMSQFSLPAILSQMQPPFGVPYYMASQVVEPVYTSQGAVPPPHLFLP